LRDKNVKLSKKIFEELEPEEKIILYALGIKWREI
jgi:hypothetical protein